MATSYLVAIRWHSGRHEVIAECDDVRFPDFDRSKLRAPFRELPLAGGERDSCVLVVRDEVAPCIGAGGQSKRLTSLLSAPGWTLLRYEAAGPSALAQRPGLRIVNIGAQGELRDAGGHLLAAYGFQPGDVALVRPDGYIGVIASDENHPAVAEYLARWKV